MHSSPSDSGFKFLFWGLMLVAVLFLAAQPLLMIGRWRVSDPLGVIAMPGAFFPVLILILLFTLVVAIVGPLTYRDASRRGMDPWLWTTVAVFVPLLVGVVIYLVVRANRRWQCADCGRSLLAEYQHCPYCGCAQTLRCGGCQRPVAGDWKMCPHCGQALRQTEVSPPTSG